MAQTSSSTLSADLQTYFSKKLLVQAEYETVLDQFAYTEKIPSNSSKTISFTQYSDIAPSTSTLTEGTTPSDTALQATAITATIAQYGQYVTLTDLGELTVKHPVTQKTTELLGVTAARSYDQVINASIVSGTQVIYANGKNARTSLAATDVITSLELRKADALLLANGARQFSDGNYVLVVDPHVQMDLQADTTVQNTVIRNGLGTSNENYKGTITKFLGFTIVRSNNIPTITSTVTVHASYAIGQGAYGVTDLQSIAMYTEAPGGVSDPLHQRTTMGYKFGFAAVILNNNFFVRIESGSNY